MAQKYKSKWTGPQVDEAIGNVSKKIDKDSLIGSNGITIKKTDSNIEISGVELVKKTIETNKVYGTDSTGGQALKPFADTPTPSALATYNDVSNLKTSVPVEDLDCTNKKYVDDAIDQIPNKLDKQTAQTESDQVYGKLADGSQTMFDVTMGATATTIPRRDTAGRIQVADGVSGNDAVNFNQLQAVVSILTQEQVNSLF